MQFSNYDDEIALCTHIFLVKIPHILTHPKRVEIRQLCSLVTLSVYK